MSRPRHPDKDLETFLQRVEAGGWRVTKKKKYFRILCPCGDHMRSVHLTPSSRDYLKNASKWLENRTCWEDRD